MLSRDDDEYDSKADDTCASLSQRLMLFLQKVEGILSFDLLVK